MTTPLTSAAARRSAPGSRPTGRTPLASRTVSGGLPATVGRPMSTSTGTTPIAAAFQSSV